MVSNIHVIHIVIVISVFIMQMVNTLPDYITRNEKVAIEKFRKLVQHDLTQDYMHTDTWLVTWLRARDLNFDNAKKMLDRALKWRNDNKIDHLKYEDFSQFRNEYFCSHRSAVDKKGQPVVFIRFGSWDVRKAVLNGYAGQLERYLYWCIFEGALITGYQLSKHTPGRNVSTTVTYVNDLEGYTHRTIACFGCLPVIINAIVSYERYYPQLYDKIIFLNTPAIYDTLVRYTRPILTKYTNQDLTVSRNDRSEWFKILTKYIPQAQLPVSLGGRKTYYL